MNQHKLVKEFNSHRPVHKIAREILDNWRAVYSDAPKRPAFITYAWPYLEAMLSLTTASRKEAYGLDDAQMVVLRFLGNVTSWRGDFARSAKAELNSIYRIYEKE